MNGYEKIVADLNTAFFSRKTRPLEWRRAQLQQIIQMIDNCEQTFVGALGKDLNRDQYTAYVFDLVGVRNEAVAAIENLEAWAQPKKAATNLLTLMDTAMIYPEPYGTVLILGAWNYPLDTLIRPAIGAIAAGNCVVMKPSEVAHHTAEAVAAIVPKYLDQDCIRVITGGVPETTALLRERFDYIFYTGSSSVGKIIMTAAAKHLTPVTLELGGKSPVYVDDTNDLGVVANRILSGKLQNNGQTCVAPDYILVKKGCVEPFIKEVKRAYEEFYEGNSLKCDGVSRIINQRHFNRLRALLGEGRVEIGGQVDEKDSNMELTVLTGVTSADPVMADEIFGPIMPILEVSGAQEAVDFINRREKPLALYVFSTDRRVQHKFIDETSAGGMTMNDVVLHIAVDGLPFGGVGSSGMGSYHLAFSFQTFSHYKPVLFKKQEMEMINKAARYPPYTAQKLKIANFIMKKNIRSRFVRWLPKCVMVGLLAVFCRLLWSWVFGGL